MAHENLKVKKQNEYNQFVTRTVKRETVGKVKCYLKAVKPNPFDKYHRKRAEYDRDYDAAQVYYYEVGANDGSYRKCTTRQDADKRFSQLIEFEKRQTEIR